jgi:hypothetical protein
MPLEYAPSNLSVNVSKLRSKNAMNCRMRRRAASRGMAYKAATISRYSRPVRDSNTAPDSGTNPTRLLTAMGSLRRSTPQIVAVPLVGSNMPVSIFRVVDLPAPFGPRKPTICPAGTSNESESTAICAPKRLVSCCKEIIQSGSLGGNRWSWFGTRPTDRADPEPVVPAGIYIKRPAVGGNSRMQGGGSTPPPGEGQSSGIDPPETSAGEKFLRGNVALGDDGAKF